MATKKKYILLGVLLVLIGASVYFYKEYNRKPADLSEITPEAKVAAAAIIDLYEEDEPKANRQYLGKTIQVNGTITEINSQQDTLVNVLIGDASSMHKVSCLLDKQYIAAIKKYNTGQQISIKGICTGYLMDVELNRCVIVEDN